MLTVGALSLGSCDSCNKVRTQEAAPPDGMSAEGVEDYHKKMRALDAGLQWKLEPSSLSLTEAERASWRLKVTVTNTTAQAAAPAALTPFLNIDNQQAIELGQALNECMQAAPWPRLAPGQSAQCELLGGDALLTPGAHEIALRTQYREAGRLRVEITKK